MIRQKTIIINISSEAILRSAFALELRIYQKKTMKKPGFWIMKSSNFLFSFQYRN